MQKNNIISMQKTSTDYGWLVLAMTGILNPVVGALVHNCGLVFVIINSAFLLTYKIKGKD